MNKIAIFPRLRNIMISIFVIGWLGIFYYESSRYIYLNSLFKRELPKVKFLYPPAGWIMFFNVSPHYGYVEVYGIKNQQAQHIDPHQILRTRSIGYDNIHRNALVSVLEPGMNHHFCRYLESKFKYFDSFAIMYVNYPDLIGNPLLRQQAVAYQCQP